MPFLSEMPHINPNAYKDKTVDIKSSESESDGYDEAENKLKCFKFVSVLRNFVDKMIENSLQKHKVTTRIPVKILSEEDENGYVLVQTLFEEVSSNFKILNKTGEIVSFGEYGYLEYQKSITHGWLAMRNGKPKPKGNINVNDDDNHNDNNSSCFITTTTEEWNNLVKTGKVDENKLYVLIDDEKEIY